MFNSHGQILLCVSIEIYNLTNSSITTATNFIKSQFILSTCKPAVGKLRGIKVNKKSANSLIIIEKSLPIEIIIFESGAFLSKLYTRLHVYFDPLVLNFQRKEKL